MRSNNLHLVWLKGPFLSLLKDHSRCIVLLSSRLKDGGDKVYLGWLYKAHQCARFRKQQSYSLCVSLVLNRCSYEFITHVTTSLSLSRLNTVEIDVVTPKDDRVHSFCCESRVPSRTGMHKCSPPDVDSANNLDVYGSYIRAFSLLSVVLVVLLRTSYVYPLWTCEFLVEWPCAPLLIVIVKPHPTLPSAWLRPTCEDLGALVLASSCITYSSPSILLKLLCRETSPYTPSRMASPNM
ncbi:hypothetical protein Tco_0618658 [Tanacetum coccineum]